MINVSLVVYLIKIMKRKLTMFCELGESLLFVPLKRIFKGSDFNLIKHSSSFASYVNMRLENLPSFWLISKEILQYF